MAHYIEIRRGVYRDSVTLLQVSVALEDDDTIDYALVAMGTALNLELAADAGFDLPDDVRSSDLVIAVDAADTDAARDLVAGALAATTTRPTDHVAAVRPRSVRSAAAGSDATVALISVPGEHAYTAAIDAIEAGLHPIVFSDNVSVDHEISLKQRAAEAGVLVMGPDCGTVVLDGAGLGFANVLLPGPIGLVSASGTGAQQVASLCSDAGVGVRHVLGVGGRDLDDEIGGRSALAALRLLDEDPRVALIGVIAKSIGTATRPTLDAAIAAVSAPVVLVPTADLTAGAHDLLVAAGVDPPVSAVWEPTIDRPARSGSVVGLYSGGTLAAEAALILGEHGDVTDLGDDQYTRGRAHPMIDDRLRRERLAAVLADDTVGAVLLDVVLGNGAAFDPAEGLAPLITGTDRPVFVSLIGTGGDPQGRDVQAGRLTDAGARVFASNAAAARAALRSVAA